MAGPAAMLIAQQGSDDRIGAVPDLTGASLARPARGRVES
jgi:hypothetical protein